MLASIVLSADGRPPEEIAGFCKTVGIAEIQQKRYVLPSGRYVGAVDEADADGSIEDILPNLLNRVRQHLGDGQRLSADILARLGSLSDGD